MSYQGGGRFQVAAAILLLMGAGACDHSPTAPTPVSISISSVSPASGSTTGGTAVTIAGKGFGSDSTVTIGGVPATGVAVQGTTLLTAVTPVEAAGAVDVVVTTGGKTATLARGFTVVAPSGANRPPVVTGIRSIGSRANQPSGLADLDETITLVATVTDAETPPDLLSYNWSGIGTFSGSGATVSWHVPASLPGTPTPVTLTLTVTESYIESGITQRNTAAGTVVMQVHDSPSEILDMGQDFLTLFSNSAVPTDQVLHNFSTTCDRGSGRASEASDVDKNRRDYIQDFSQFRIARLPPVQFNFGGSCASPNGPRPADACAKFTVHWVVTNRNPPDAGMVGAADGTDYVTAVWESNRWFLCHSDFKGASTNLTTGVTRQIVW